MNCEEIQVYLEGCAAGPPEDKAVAEHLGQCQACQEYAGRLASENRVLREVLAKPPAEEQWLRVKAGLAERIELQLVWQRRLRRTWWSLAAAAAVLLCVCGGLVVFRGQTPNFQTAGNWGQSPKYESLASGLARLQQEVRNKQLLDELEQLQIAFREAGDADGKSVAEDAELYVERILALDGAHPDQASEILAGIKAAGIHQRVQKVRESIADDAPAPLRASLDLAATTFDQAVFLASAK